METNDKMTDEKAIKILSAISSYYASLYGAIKNEFPKETICGYSLADIANACTHGTRALKEKC